MATSSTKPISVSDIAAVSALDIRSCEDSDLIASLHALNVKSPKLVKSSLYPAPADASIKVRSWKMNEFKYYDIPSPFPTLARGLFTREIVEGGKTRYQIVVRGYDKFFNIGEVPWTAWESIEKHTAPPYVLSLKSNGCIIFIAALTPEKLLITSKHSLGPVAGQSMSHAQAGEMWLRKYLVKVKKTEKDLAGVLWAKNWTAIAELCDDDFEEHVLGYSPEKTGLHLHGLNVRTKEFETLPAETVDAFAAEWGFIKTPHITFNTIADARKFTQECAESGEWNGEAVEGFVVRTHVTDPPTSERAEKMNKSGEVARSPYKTGSSFFFKVKFDEPYMMYRDWREVTKSLLSKGLDASLLPKSKMKRAETKLYVQWVIREIKRNPTAFENYNKGKGIIATREMYLNWLKSGEGEHDLQEVLKEETTTRAFGKTVIVPVAIPGCGKTVVSVALSKLFGFAHTQSDDVHAKKAAPIFIKNVQNLLKTNDVVIADKNNHLSMHRKQLREATKDIDPPVRLLALNWSLDKPPATVHRICGDRVTGRGDNHQSLRADPTSAKSHEEVIWMFINTTEELTPAEVDDVVDMDLEEDLEAAVRRAVGGCVKILGLKQPSDAEIKAALTAAQTYSPATKKPDDLKEKKKAKAGPRFYGILPEVDLLAMLDKRLSSSDVSAATRAFWEKLKTDKRYAIRPHVTLVHRNSQETEKDLWDRCEAIAGLPLPPVFKGRLGSVLCNGRAMVITVEQLSLDVPGGGSAKEGEGLLASLPSEVSNRLHITVGTKEASVQPVEGKIMVEGWRKKGKTGNVVELKLDPVEVRGRVKGLNG